ncbi:unnamed protein product [Thelazia callipaeda]|uniref:Sushi domain-containing protein n=1 Tax=Thelazia callipaeda TaxID=103827 RepID=A0A0N5CNA8_THECL|nr:unnamed protein product [Thelazia callipaeda]
MACYHSLVAILISTLSITPILPVNGYCFAHPRVENGLVTYNFLSPIPEMTYSTGSLAALSCNLGFMVSGSGTTTCTSAGSWEPALGSCVLISEVMASKTLPTCGPANHAMGIITYVPGTLPARFQSGAVATLTCPVGQKVVNGASRATCENGTWSAKLGACKQAKFSL